MSALLQLMQYARETAVLESIAETLEWDERTYMPAAAGAYRAEQLTWLSSAIHARKTDKQFGALLEGAAVEIDGRADEDAQATVRVLRREFQQRSKVPPSLVKELTRNSLEGQQAWVAARRDKCFETLQPFLEKTIQLKREEAEALGYEECLYDALLDQYEPREKTRRVRDIFASLRDQLMLLLGEIIGNSSGVSAEILHRDFPRAAQREIGRLAAETIGFDFSRGRLDVTQHPFCTSLGPHDVRLTTRYDESFFSSAFYGTLHEAGHGIYEQGLREDYFGLPPGKYASMAIHESQSRLWENMVGRSKSFWQCFFPHVRKAFPTALGDVSATDFYRATNQVQPSLIRVEADEVTYNLHIIIRFELEQELMEGSLSVADLPDAWNSRYEEFLGVKPADDAEGVLQDIHWSAAYIGYFPTYSLGNLYAAQFFDQAERDLGDLDAQFADGDFHSLREWLNTNVHRRGQCVTAAELVEQVTGSPLSEKFLLNRLRDKFADVYRVPVE